MDTVQSRKGALKVTKWASDLPIVFNCSVIEFFTNKCRSFNGNNLRQKQC